MKIKYTILFILVLASVLQAVYYYPRLPDRVASHFGPGGQADGWSTKTSFILTDVGVACGTALLFIFLPMLMNWTPVSMINMPNKEYWLAPTRRPQTTRKLQSSMLEMGIATLLFLLVIFQLAIRANLTGSQQLPEKFFWIFLGGFLAFTLVWSLRFYLTFSKIPSSISDSNEPTKTI